MYNDNRVKPLHIMLPKTSTYVKSYDEQTKQMYVLIEDDDLLESYDTIWDKVSTDIKKNLIAGLSTIMKLQNFTIKNPKVDSNHTCLAIISLDSALKKDNNYYPQVF